MQLWQGGCIIQSERVVGIPQALQLDGPADLVHGSGVRLLGGHMYDLTSAEPGEPVKGRHHFEWKSAKEIFEDFKEKP